MIFILIHKAGKHFKVFVERWWLGCMHFEFKHQLERSYVRAWGDAYHGQENCYRMEG